ncbi:hypothetical protein BU17DRAFT_60368 [Hysterangium stoloniferum]|nr:hypothetical protein BU17DRAFT_60368 [Hysterangium stoloniferum]
MDQHPPAFSDIVAPFAQQEVSDQYPPIYVHEDEYEELWGRWIISAKASQKVLDIRAALAILEPKLQSQIKEHERCKQTSSKILTELRGLLTTARSLFRLHILRQIYSNGEPDPHDRIRQEFKLAVQAETSAQIEVESSREKIQTLKAQAKGVVTELERARTTIQHAHRFFTMTLKRLDGVRAMTFFPGSGLVKQKEYMPSETAIKAQACFHETLRVLEPYMNRVSTELMEDFNKLEKWGLLQAPKIFALACETQVMSGVTRTVNVLYQTQEAVFVCLTHIAIWVQDQVPVAEAEARRALTKRDEDRLQLVTIWKTRIGSEIWPNIKEDTTEPG